MSQDLKIAMFIIIGLMIILAVYTLLNTKLQKKKVEEVIKNIFKGGSVESVKLPYNFKATYKGETFLIKYIAIPSNSSVVINYQYTWQLWYGGSKENLGRMYPKTRFLTEVEGFCKAPLKEHEHKICILYKDTEHVDKYINENEMVPVDCIDDKWGYNIVRFNHFEEDMVKVMNHIYSSNL